MVVLLLMTTFMVTFCFALTRSFVTWWGRGGGGGGVVGVIV
jgi:hypothetical protein